MIQAPQPEHARDSTRQLVGAGTGYRVPVGRSGSGGAPGLLDELFVTPKIGGEASLYLPARSAAPAVPPSDRHEGHDMRYARLKTILDNLITAWRFDRSRR